MADKVQRPGGPPGELEHPVSWGQAARVVLGTLLLFVAANVVAGVFLGRFPMNRTSWIVQSKWELAATAGPVDDVFVGDSSCNQAIAPRVWQDATGRMALNLCTIGDFGLVDDVWLLEAYLAHHSAPQRVVVQHVYDVWRRPLARTLVAEVPRRWGFWSGGALPVELSLDELRQVALLRYVPVFGKRESIQMALTRVVRARRPGVLLEPPFELERDGFMPWAEAAPARVRRDAERHRAAMQEHPPSLSADNQRALRALNELAQRYRFEVTIVPSPVFDGLAAEPAYRRYFEAQLDLVAQAVAGLPQVKLQRPQRTFAAEQMENVDHVVGDAAADFTAWLAAQARAW